MLRSNGIAIALGFIVVGLVILVSCAMAFLFPADQIDTSALPRPEVGRVYTKEEIDRKELLAQEEMRRAKVEFTRKGFSGVVRSEWKRWAPWIVLVAIPIVCGVGYRTGPQVVVIATVPVIVLSFFLAKKFIWPTLATVELVFCLWIFRIWKS